MIAVNAFRQAIVIRPSCKAVPDPPAAEKLLHE
jgi:hypothetical protein